MPENDELLTEDELEALDLCAELARAMGRIIDRGRTRDGDIAEAYSAIHVLQRMIAAQGTARAYPDRCRLLGE